MLLVNLFSFGQETKIEEETHTEKESKIRLNPFFSYDFNLSSKTTVNGIYTEYYSYKNFNYRVGVDIEYRFTNKFSLSTGINYSNKDYSFYADCYVCDPSSSFDFTTELRLIEIPLIGIYTYQINEIELFGQLGVINQVNINVDISELSYAPANMNDYNLSGKIGVGISYPVINKHRLFIATDYVFSIKDIYSDYNYKLKTLGIRMGVQFVL